MGGVGGIRCEKKLSENWRLIIFRPFSAKNSSSKFWREIADRTGYWCYVTCRNSDSKCELFIFFAIGCAHRHGDKVVYASLPIKKHQRG